MSQTLDLLKALLQQPIQAKRSYAAMNLVNPDDEGVEDVLIDALLAEDDLFVQEDIIWAIARAGIREKAVDPLLKIMTSEDAEHRHRATHTLGKIADKRAIPALIIALQDDSDRVVSKAIVALGQIADERIVPDLMIVLGHENPEVQATLSQILREFGETPVPYLLDALTDASWRKREHAIDILAHMQPEIFASHFVQALQDNSWQVRFAALSVVGDFKDLIYRPQIEVMTHDPEKRVQMLATELLRRLPAGQASVISTDA